MERPERPTRHRSNPIVKPKLSVRASFSSDSESEHNDENGSVELAPPYYRSMDNNTSDGPSTSTGTSQTNQSNETSGERKISLSPGFSVMKSFRPCPLISTQELDEEPSSRPEPQGQEPTVRSRKRSAATAAAASVIFDTVDSLIASNTSGGNERAERSSDSPDRQEFQHNDFVIRPRSFCSIEYCNSNGTRVPYKHKRLNAPIDLTAGLPASSSTSTRSVPGMSSGGPSASCIRGETNDSSPYLSRSSPLYQRREQPQPPPQSCSSSILRQFDELMNSPTPARRPRRATGFNVRFCDNPTRFSDEPNNDDVNNIPFLSGEPARPQRNSNLDDYCDLVGNFLFNYPSSSLHSSDSTRNVNSSVVFQPSSPPDSPPMFTSRERERNTEVIVGSSSPVQDIRRPPLNIPDIVNNFMGHLESNRNNSNGGEANVEQQNDDVILVELSDRAPYSPRSPLHSPSDSPGPYVVPSSRSPTPSPPRPVPPPPELPTGILRNKSQSSNLRADVPMTLQELNQTLVSLLECPVCLDHATPPIYQCCKGHIVCQNCHPRLSICPICRSRLPGDRNSSMEKVAEKLMYPCKNTLTGCTMMLKLDDKQEHEEGCGFRHYSCIIPSCQWKGYKPELVVHLQSNHPDKLIDGANKEVLVPLSVPLGSGMLIAHHWIQAAHNEVFNVIFHVDLSKRVMKGCVTYIGAPEKADKFTYQFELKQRTPPFRKLTYSRTTLTDTQKPSQQLNISNDFSINIDLARLYRPENIPAHVIPINISIDTIPVPAPAE